MIEEPVWTQEPGREVWNATVGKFNLRVRNDTLNGRWPVYIEANNPGSRPARIAEVRPALNRLAAMTDALDWVQSYLMRGPDRFEDRVARNLEDWRSLFKTRADVLNHLFFVNGNGYDWLDGALYSSGAGRLMSGPPRSSSDPDPGGPRRFYPLCEYSAICGLPDDLRPDWAAGAREAVELIRTRSLDDDEGRANRVLIENAARKLGVDCCV